MGEINAVHVGIASQLAEAERIVESTREKIAAGIKDGWEPSAEQRNTLAKREAIALTLTRINNGENPWRPD